MVPWHAPGYTSAAGTGLWAQEGSQGSGEPGLARALPGLFLYLRPFPPGTRNRLEAGSANDWIGSRSRAPRAP